MFNRTSRFLDEALAESQETLLLALSGATFLYILIVV